MSNGFIWQNLQKNLDDSTTIDEAISEAITAHNGDIEAHMGPEAAIEAHRENSVIDHPAESVVNDKIAGNARRWVAIVDPDSETDFDTIEGAVEHARQMGGGDIFIQRGTHYLGSDITLIPTIGMYGAGIGETSIKSNNSTTRKMSWAIDSYSEGFYSYFENSAPSRNYIDFNGAYTDGDFPVAGMLVLDWTGGSATWVVDSADEIQQRVYFDTNVPAIDPDSEIEIVAGTELENGSQYATITGTSLAYFDEYYPGMNLCNASRSIDLEIESYEGNGVVKLAELYSGTSGVYHTHLRFTKKTMINFSGLSFNRTSNRVMLDRLDTVGNYNITDCENVSIDQSIAGNMHGVYINCRFDGWATNESAEEYDYMRNCVAIGCIWTARRNNIKPVGVGRSGRLYGCDFDGNGYTGVQWLTLYRGDWVIRDCNFSYWATSTVVSSAMTGSQQRHIFEGNYISCNNNASLTIQGRNISITGNKIITSGTGRFVLGASSQNNICRDNFVSFAVTNSGSGNSVGDNLTVA